MFVGLITWGCSDKSSLDGKTGIEDKGDIIAYVSVNKDSIYEKTFKDTGLGVVFDFNLKLPHADTSWVDLWVEGYSQGKPTEDLHTQLSYGLSPNKVKEGSIGFGIISPNSSNMNSSYMHQVLNSHPL